MAERIEVDSAGTQWHVTARPTSAPRSTPSAGLRPHRSARAIAALCDFDAFDLVLVMDEANRAATPAPCAPVTAAIALYLLAHFAAHMKPAEVPDPYYGGPAGFGAGAGHAGRRLPGPAGAAEPGRLKLRWRTDAEVAVVAGGCRPTLRAACAPCATVVSGAGAVPPIEQEHHATAKESKTSKSRQQRLPWSAGVQINIGISDKDQRRLPRACRACWLTPTPLYLTTHKLPLDVTGPMFNLHHHVRGAVHRAVERRRSDCRAHSLLGYVRPVRA